MGYKELLDFIEAVPEHTKDELVLLKKIEDAFEKHIVDLDEFSFDDLVAFEVHFYLYAPVDVCDDYEETNRGNLLYFRDVFEDVKYGLEALKPIRQPVDYL